MEISGRNFDDYASVYVDGRRVDASVDVTEDEQERVVIELKALPDEGMHTLQVQSDGGLFSNDFIFHVALDEESARNLKKSIDEAQLDSTRCIGDGH